MELQQLKYFKTVAEVGKIAAAADALFISAPALSTAVSRLEKELGIPLFDRTNNSIRLNRQGRYSCVMLTKSSPIWTLPSSNYGRVCYNRGSMYPSPP